MANDEEKPQSSAARLVRAAKLFTDAHAANMGERRVAALAGVSKACAAGFLLGDIECVHPLVSLALERVAGGEAAELRAPLCDVLRLCAKPFLITSVTEDQRCAHHLASLVGAIGFALLSPDAAVRATAATTLLPFVHVTDPEASRAEDPIGARRALLQHEVLNESGVLESVAEAMRAVGAAADLTSAELVAASAQELALARLMNEVSASPQGATFLVESGAGDLLISLLGSDTDSEQVLCAIQALWNVLELCETSVWQSIVTPQMIRMLGGIFGRLLTDGFKQREMELRNDSLLLATLCARSAGDELLEAFAMPTLAGPDQATSFVKLAMVACAWPTLGLVHDVTSNGRVALAGGPGARAPGSWEELELRKWGFTLASMLVGHKSCLRKVVEMGCIESCLSYLEFMQEPEALEYTAKTLTSYTAPGRTLPRNSTAVEVATAAAPPALTGWNPEAVRELQAAALRALIAVAPRASDNFREAQGSEFVLLFIISTAQSVPVEPPRRPAVPGVSNVSTRAALDPSYLNTGGNGGVASRFNLRQAALTVILGCCDIQGFPDELGDLGAVDVMLGLIGEPIEHDNTATSYSALAIRQDALCVLSTLCLENETNQRALARARGISLLRSLLAYDATSPVRSAAILVATLDAVWNAVLGSDRNAARFLALDGVGALLALLEDAPAITHGQVLSALADLCESAQTGDEAARHIVAWASEKTALQAPQLLLRVWAQQEDILTIATDVGTITNTDRPLAGTGNLRAPHQLELSSMLQARGEMERSKVRGTTGSLAVVSSAVEEQLAAQDVKGKVFAVFCKVGFGGFEVLSDEEEARLALVKQYAVLRKGAAVEDAAAELEAEGVRPITPDREELAEQLLANKYAIDAVTDEQDGIRMRVMAGATQKENVFLSSVRLLQQDKQDTAAAGRLSLMPKDSFMAKRAEVKRMKQEMLRNSMKK